MTNFLTGAMLLQEEVTETQIDTDAIVCEGEGKGCMHVCGHSGFEIVTIPGTHKKRLPININLRLLFERALRLRSRWPHSLVTTLVPVKHLQRVSDDPPQPG